MKTPTIEELFAAGNRAQETGAVDDWAELSRIGEELASLLPRDSDVGGFCQGVAISGALQAYDSNRATLLLEQYLVGREPEKAALLRGIMNDLKAELEAS